MGNCKHCQTLSCKYGIFIPTTNADDVIDYFRDAIEGHPTSAVEELLIVSVVKCEAVVAGQGEGGS